jgi:hypothetical protein
MSSTLSLHECLSVLTHKRAHIAMYLRFFTTFLHIERSLSLVSVELEIQIIEPCAYYVDLDVVQFYQFMLNYMAIFTRKRFGKTF